MFFFWRPLSELIGGYRPTRPVATVPFRQADRNDRRRIAILGSAAACGYFFANNALNRGSASLSPRCVKTTDSVVGRVFDEPLLMKSVGRVPVERLPRSATVIHHGIHERENCIFRSS